LGDINRDKNEEINCKPYLAQIVKYFSNNPKAKVIVTDNFWKELLLILLQLTLVYKRQGFCIILSGI